MMVEAMFERSANYFKQFYRQLKFLIVEEKLTFSIGNLYAVCAHFDSEFCNLVDSYYHILTDTSTFENELFCALFLYSFQILVLHCTNGDFAQIWRLMDICIQSSN